MPYGTPDTGPVAKYTAVYSGIASGVGQVLTILIDTASEGGSEADRDGVFQQFIDLLDTASFLTLQGGRAEKHQDTNTEVTPTP